MRRASLIAGRVSIVSAPLARWYVAPRAGHGALNCSGESAIRHAEDKVSPLLRGRGEGTVQPQTLQSFLEPAVEVNSDRTVAGDVYGSRQSGHTHR